MRKISLTGKRFANLLVGNELQDGKYECSCDCGNTTIVHKHNLRNGNTKSCGCLRSVSKIGNKNASWKGKQVGYNALHEWIRNRYEKPEFCEHCETQPPRDLANKSQKYLRDLSDWWYLCRKCHMDLDGRNDQLRASNHSRIGIPIKLWKRRV
jgi:hypothetical protein